MKIGIDFDNTISNYDLCFKFLCEKLNLIDHKNLETKKSIKSKILALKKGKFIWMKMQGEAYGKYINKASVMSDFLKFLIISKNRNNEIVIVSHKTEYGHFDKNKVPLRSSALKWMQNKKIINSNISNINKNSVYFADTLQQKIDIIDKLKCDYFIDDLKKVLDNKKFPKKTKKILLGQSKSRNTKSFGNWSEIIDYFYPKIITSDVKDMTNFFHNNKLNKISNFKNGGNSKSYKLRLKNKKNYFVKIYPSLSKDNKNRLVNEFNSLKFISKFPNFNVPKPIAMNKDLNIGIYEYISGKKINKPSLSNLNFFINFIKKLKKISQNKNNLKKFDLASETSTNFSDLLIEIENRKNILINNLDKKKYKLIINDLDFIWKSMKTKSQKSKIKLIEEDFILSPSDIGYHNAIKYNNKIYILDFEYFGIDDPIKITCDFILHPANNLTFEEITKWLNCMRKIFSNINNFNDRFKIYFPYYLFRWILIILKIINNNFQKDYMKINNLNKIQVNKSIKSRISLAKKYIELLIKINTNNLINLKDFSYVK